MSAEKAVSGADVVETHPRSQRGIREDNTEETVKVTVVQERRVLFMDHEVNRARRLCH
jgi:hypothetical protein